MRIPSQLQVPGFPLGNQKPATARALTAGGSGSPAKWGVSCRPACPPAHNWTPPILRPAPWASSLLHTSWLAPLPSIALGLSRLPQAVIAERGQRPLGPCEQKSVLLCSVLACTQRVPVALGVGSSPAPGTGSPSPDHLPVSTSLLHPYPRQLGSLMWGSEARGESGLNRDPTPTTVGTLLSDAAPVSQRGLAPTTPCLGTVLACLLSRGAR